MTSKHYVLTYFHQNSSRDDTLPNPPPLPLSFTVITDHLRAGEVLTGWGPQSSAALVDIPVSFQSRTAQSAGVGGFSIGHALSLFLSVLILPHHYWQPFKLNRSITKLPNTRRGEFTSRESEVKTERTSIMSSFYLNQPLLLKTIVSILILVKFQKKPESVTNMFPQGAGQNPLLLVNCKCDGTCPCAVGI